MIAIAAKDEDSDEMRAYLNGALELAFLHSGPHGIFIPNGQSAHKGRELASREHRAPHLPNQADALSITPRVAKFLSFLTREQAPWHPPCQPCEPQYPNPAVRCRGNLRPLGQRGCQRGEGDIDPIPAVREVTFVERAEDVTELDLSDPHRG